MTQTTIPTDEQITERLAEFGVTINEDVLFVYKCGYVDGGVTREQAQELIRGQQTFALEAERLEKQAAQVIQRADDMVQLVATIKELKTT